MRYRLQVGIVSAFDAHLKIALGAEVDRIIVGIKHVNANRGEVANCNANRRTNHTLWGQC
jgi:hypothetical protein